MATLADVTPLAGSCNLILVLRGDWAGIGRIGGKIGRGREGGWISEGKGLMEGNLGPKKNHRYVNVFSTVRCIYKHQGGREPYWSYCVYSTS